MARAHHFLWSFLVLEMFTVINSYVVNLKGATIDAPRFQELAERWANSPQFEIAFDAEFYVQFLGFQFWVFGPSEFLATQVNVLALVASAAILTELIDDLHGTRVSWVITPFLLWPSLITRGTTTLREPIMILVLLAAGLLLVRYVRSGSIKELLRALGVLFVGALFHKAYAVLFAVFIVFGFWRTRPNVAAKDGLWRVIQRGAVIAAGLGFVAVLVLGAGGERGLQPLVSAATGDTEFATRVIGSKESRDFRTTYSASVDASNPIRLVASLPKNWAFYNLAPFPWQARTGFDLLAVAEGLVRTAGIAAAISMWRSFDQARRREYFPVLFLHFSIMAIFAAGTSNYGTASRHHLVTTGFTLLYIAGFLIERRRRNGKTSLRTHSGFAESGHDLVV